MYTRKLLTGVRQCDCHSDKVASEEDSDDGFWLVFCMVCMCATDAVSTEEEAVKMWEENNVFGFTGSKPR